MQTRTHPANVLADRLPVLGIGAPLRTLVLVAAGIVALTIAAKIKVPFWPVPITMQTFAVMTLGTLYGARTGGLTLLAYIALGALGADVFTGSHPGVSGLAYVMGGTGGYLLGFLLAATILGALAERGWDRQVLSFAGALILAEILIFAPGVLWLGHLYAGAKGWDWVLGVGFTDFLPAEALKMALAAAAVPALWRLAGSAD